MSPPPDAALRRERDGMVKAQVVTAPAFRVLGEALLAETVTVLASFPVCLFHIRDKQILKQSFLE